MSFRFVRNDRRRERSQYLENWDTDTLGRSSWLWVSRLDDILERFVERRQCSRYLGRNRQSRRQVSEIVCEDPRRLYRRRFQAIPQLIHFFILYLLRLCYHQTKPSAELSASTSRLHSLRPSSVFFHSLHFTEGREVSRSISGGSCSLCSSIFLSLNTSKNVKDTLPQGKALKTEQGEA